MLLGILRALRPKQWLKNLLVFAAPVAAGAIDDRTVVVESVLAFVAFCLAASGTYLINDVLDVEADRRHPTKRHRPIAAGTVPVGVAGVLAGVLVVAALVVGFAVRVELGTTLVAYIVLTVTYSLWLKRIPVVDLIAVASGFVLRAVAGGAATDVPISQWFFIVTSFGALFMVSGKRSGEASDLGVDAVGVRATLRDYSSSYLGYLRSLSSGVMLVAYCLWAFNSANAHPDGGFWYELSIVPFALATLRYALLLDQGKGAEPENLVLSDRVLLLSGAAWAIIYGYAVYTGRA